MANTNSYDAVGNYNVSGWNHNNANQLTSRPSVTYSYDNNGNELTQVNANGPDPGTENFTWDYENRLVNFAPPTGDTNLYKKAYTYDPFGRLVRELATNNTTGATVSDATYIWDGANDFEQLNTANGNVVEKYVYGLGVDEPLALVSGSASVFVEQDALGSITTLTNSSGAVSDTFVYGTNGWGEPSHTGGTTSLFLRFTGRDYDGSSNLYYLRARWYDPATGRFVSEDPIGFRGGNDFYDYVANEPISRKDPFGLAAPAILPILIAPKPIPFPALPIAAIVGETWVGEQEIGTILDYRDWNKPDIGSALLPGASPLLLRNKARKQCKEKDCDEQYEADVAVCRALHSRACYDQAMQRYAACIAGRPMPPFPFRKPN